MHWLRAFTVLLIHQDDDYVGPVPTYYAAVRLELRNPNPNPGSLWRFELKLDTPVTSALTNVQTN